MFGFGKQQPKGASAECDMQLKGMLEMIDCEFRGMLTDSPALNKKKYPDVKEKLEATVAWIAEVKTSRPSEIDSHLEILINTFFQIVESRQSKLYLQIFNIVQRLVMTIPTASSGQADPKAFQMSRESRERLLQLFSTVTFQDQQGKSSGTPVALDEMSQIKILQIIMIFLDPNQTDTISKKFINDILKTCFQLFDSKSTSSSSSGNNEMIKSTLQACIRQLLTILFEILNQKSKSIIGHSKFTLAQSKQNVHCELEKLKLDEIYQMPIFAVVEDFIQNVGTALFIHEQNNVEVKKQPIQNTIGDMMGAVSNQHVWNFKPSATTKATILEMLSFMFEQTKSLFVYFPRLLKIFTNQIMPTLSQMLKNIEVNSTHSSSVGIRVVKGILAIIDNLCVRSQATMEDLNFHSQGSLQSEGGQSENSNEAKTIQFQGLDNILLAFSKMADFEASFSKMKEKELSSLNIASYFQKLNWRHLVSIEGMAILFQNWTFVFNLLKKDGGKTICIALDSLNRFMNFILTMDHRNAQIMINGTTDQFINLQGHTNNQKKMKAPSNSDLFQASKVSKIVEDAMGLTDDESTKNNFLNAAHFQKLIQETINGFVTSICSIYESTKSSQPAGVAAESKSTSTADSRRKEAKSEHNEISDICEILHEIMNKIHVSVQCNYASFNGPPLDLKPNTSSLYSFSKKNSQYVVYLQNLLNSFENMIKMLGYHNIELEWRDAFVKSLSSFCYQREIEVSRQGAPGVIAAAGFVVSVGNVMACQTLVDVCNYMFSETQYYETPQSDKRNSQNNQFHEQDLHMWQIIVETILRVDGTLINQIEAKTKKPLNKGSLNNLLNLDASHLVDFAQIQQKVNKYEHNQRMKSNNDSEQASPFADEAAALSRYSTIGAKTSSANRPSLIEQNQQSLSQVQLKTQWCFNAIKFQGGKYLSVIEINQNKLQKVNQSVIIPSQQSLSVNEDLQTLKQQLDTIFINSYKASKMGLFQFCGAFQRLLNEFVANGLKISNIDQELTQQSMSIQLIKRLAELTYVNIDRLEIIWDQHVAMMCIMLQNASIDASKGNKSNIFIKLSIEGSQALVMSYFQHKRHSLKGLRQDLIDPLMGDAQFPLDILSPRVNTSREASEGSNHIQETNENHSQSLEEVDDHGQWRDNNWQQTILEPITQIMLHNDTTTQEKLLALRSIEKIIQLCGQNMKTEGWTLIIDNLGKASEISLLSSMNNNIQSPEIMKLEQTIVSNGFKCLKLIISNYIQELGQQNFIGILNCIKRYAEQENENINSNLTAIGMFMNVADYTAKTSKEQNDGTASSGEAIDVDFIWENIFNTMQIIGKQFVSEVRRSLIQTLENIIMNHGSLLSERVWDSLYKSTLISLIRHSSQIFIEIGTKQLNDDELDFDNQEQEPSRAPTIPQPNGQSQRKKMAFDDESVLKALKVNDDQSWSGTCIQLISSIYRTIQKYIQINHSGQMKTEQLDAFWLQFHEILCSLVFHASQSESQLDKFVSQIIVQIFKSIDDFLRPECALFLKTRFVNILLILESTHRWILQEIDNFEIFISANNKNTCRNKSLILKISIDIISCLNKIYSAGVVDAGGDGKKFEDYDSVSSGQQILKFLNSLYMGCRQVGIGYIRHGEQYKLLAEEAAILRFLQEFNYYCSKQAQSQTLYFKYLLDKLDFTTEHSDCVSRRILQFINSIILTGQIAPDILVGDGLILDMIISKLTQIMNQRYNLEKFSKMVTYSQVSTDEHIFLRVGIQIISVSSFLIDPLKFKETVEQLQNQEETGISNDYHSWSGNTFGTEYQKPSGEIAKEKLEIYTYGYENNLELKSKVWNALVPMLKHTLLFDLDKFEGKDEDIYQDYEDKEVLADIIRASQTLDMQLMNFVVNTLLPCCAHLHEAERNSGIEDELINIVDSSLMDQQGESSHPILKALGNSSSLTSAGFKQYCLFNLFQICKFGNQSHSQGESETFKKMKTKISSQSTPIMLKRCKGILKKFSQDESRSGSIHMNETRVQEIVMILKELMQLANSIDQTNRSRFLIELMPNLTDLITTNNKEIKEHLKQIFVEISQEVIKLNQQ